MNWALLAILPFSFALQSWGQSRSVLIDLNIQRVGDKAFEYNSSPLLPLGEPSTFPLKGKDTEGLELQITPKIPKEAPGKNILEFEIQLREDKAGILSVVSKVKTITRLHETVSISEKSSKEKQILFTITPVELQNP